MQPEEREGGGYSINSQDRFLHTPTIASVPRAAGGIQPYSKVISQSHKLVLYGSAMTRKAFNKRNDSYNPATDPVKTRAISRRPSHARKETLSG